MPKIGSKSQKLREILRFENLARWRFRLGSTHEKDVDSVALLESFRALKLTLLESFRALKLLKP